MELPPTARQMSSDDEFQITETYAAQDAALASIWSDPELDIYDVLAMDPTPCNRCMTEGLARQC
jgi:hypothetical protein